MRTGLHLTPDRQLTPIPLHRVATVMPFIHYLHQADARVERELKRTSLPVMAMDDPDCFIPSHNYWDFIANVAEREGIRDLGFLVGLQSGADAADPGIARRLAKLSSLHRAMEQFCKVATTEISQVALWLEPADNSTHRLHYQTSFGIEHPAYVHFQWYGLMATLATIQLFAGRRWQPRTIGLGSTTKPGQTIRKYFPQTDFITGQAHCFISITDIANLLGYSDPSHFARAFRRIAGAGPREYLRQCQE